MKDTQPMKCDNCGLVIPYDQLPDASNLSQRIDVGHVYSDKECPECGALCYPEPPKLKVKVEVLGGVAYETDCSPGVAVEIQDHDNERFSKRSKAAP